MVTSAATTTTMSGVPTGEDRRSRIIPTLRGLCGPLVTSATTTVSTAFPTGVRSPRTGLDDSAYCVSLYGDAHYVNYVDGVMFSYGSI